MQRAAFWKIILCRSSSFPTLRSGGEFYRKLRDARLNAIIVQLPVGAAGAGGGFEGEIKTNKGPRPVEIFQYQIAPGEVKSKPIGGHGTMLSVRAVIFPVKTFRRAEIARTHAAAVHDDFLQHHAGIHHPDFQCVPAGI